MDKGQREELAARVLAFSSADHTEVAIVDENARLTRFTHNDVHQNVASADVSVRVRAIVGGRTGVASSNELAGDRLRETVDRALAMAKLAPVDRDLAPLPSGGPSTAVANSYVAATAKAGPAERARLCAEIFAVAKSENLWSAGFAATSSSGITVCNSNGARASYDGTDCAVNVKMNGSDSTGYAEAYTADVDAVDAREIAQTAARKAQQSQHPRAVEAGPWTVILEPAAFGELLSYVADHFSAQAVEEGSSFLSDGMDKSYFGSNVSIADDFAHPLAPGMPFDWEGQPTRRVTLVENGVARGFVTDSAYAKKLERPNTGHALPAPNAYGPQATHLVLAAGEKSIDELIAQTARGLLVTRFWYIRTVDQRRAIVTGMTRDGTFLIENGALVGGVRNMRFNQSILEALRHCEFGNTLRRTGSYAYSIVVPAAKIEGFTFSSGTDF